MPPNDDKECDKDEFNKTSCGYVTMVDKMYSCADVKKNFPYYENKHLKPVKQCDDVCPASGSGWFNSNNNCYKSFILQLGDVTV